MKILIIDDDKIKLASILQAIQEVADNCSIDNAICGKEALRLMSKKRYDLLIIDLNLPFTEDEEPSEEGGRKVVNEIYRNVGKIYVPNYIVGLTQYEDFVNNYFNVWKVFHYKSNDTEWVGNLKKLLSHITYVSYIQQDKESEKPTIFVEGETDYKYLSKAVDLFFPELNDEIRIRFTKGNGGASWVVNQSLIWMNSYHKDSDVKDIIAVAVLDKDSAGINASKSIREMFKTDKQRSILKVYKLNERNCNFIKNFFVAGCDVQFEIESMFELEQIKYAENQGWLEDKYSDVFEIPKEFDVYNENLTQFLLRKGLEKDNLLYLRKISWGCKEKFCNYILGLDESKQKTAFKNFENLLLEVFKKIGVK